MCFTAVEFSQTIYGRGALQMLDGDLDQEMLVVTQGLQQAENMIRAGLERARYNVLQRTKRRTREPEAAYVQVRDGTVFASTYDNSLEVRRRRRGKPGVGVWLWPCGAALWHG